MAKHSIEKAMVSCQKFIYQSKIAKCKPMQKMQSVCFPYDIFYFLAKASPLKTT